MFARFRCNLVKSRRRPGKFPTFYPLVLPHSHFLPIPGFAVVAHTHILVHTHVNSSVHNRKHLCTAHTLYSYW